MADISNITGEQILGLCESLKDQTDKAKDLASQIKMLKKDNSDRIKEFAKDNGLKSKYVNDLYKHYLQVVDSDQPVEESDDFYTLLSLLDAALQQEKPEEDA